MGVTSENQAVAAHSTCIAGFWWAFRSYSGRGCSSRLWASVRRDLDGHEGTRGLVFSLYGSCLSISDCASLSYVRTAPAPVRARSMRASSAPVAAEGAIVSLSRDVLILLDPVSPWSLFLRGRRAARPVLWEKGQQVRVGARNCCGFSS